MSRKGKKATPQSRRQRRNIRIQQIMFAAIAIIIIASFLITLIA
jgi:hypothetical protein